MKVVLFQEALDYQHAFSYQSNNISSVIPGLETWTVAKAVIDALSPVVQQFVTNQRKGYWLLSDAVASTLGLCIQLYKEHIEKGLVTLKLEASSFDSKLEVLQLQVMSKVINALNPYLSFTISYLSKHTCNMSALMLDPRYRGLSLVKDYVGTRRASQVVAETDQNALFPSLVIVFKQLNPSNIDNIQALSPTSKDLVDDNSVFGSTTSYNEAIVSHLKAELSLFRRLHIGLRECKNPLAWWKDRQVQFLNVGFFTQQILRIVGTDIQT